MSKQKSQKKSEGYDFFGEWKRHVKNMLPDTQKKRHPGKKKKFPWAVFLIYGVLFWYGAHKRGVTNDQLLDLERLSATALMYSNPLGDNWIASDWNYKQKAFSILYIERPFVPMIKTATYSGGRFYNVTVGTDGAMNWYCQIYKKPPKDANLGWAFPEQIVTQYCIS